MASPLATPRVPVPSCCLFYRSAIIFLHLLLVASQRAVGAPISPDVIQSGVNRLQRRLVPDPSLPPYYQPVTTQTFMDTVPISAPDTGTMDPAALAELAMRTIMATMGMAEEDVLLTSSLVDTSSNLCFVYGNQMINGVPIVNANVVGATDMAGNMVALSHSFTEGGLQRRNSLRRRDVTVEAAVTSIGTLLQFNTDSLVVTTDPATGVTTVAGAAWATGPIQVKNVMYVTSNDQVVTAYFVKVATMGTVYNCYVSTATGEVLGCSNLSSSSFHNLDSAFEDALRGEAPQDIEALNHLYRRQGQVFVQNAVPPVVSYKVVPFQFSSTDQTGGATVVVQNPADATASPNGWHSQVNQNTGATEFVNAPFGNNVFAVNNSLNNPNPLAIPLAFPTPAFQFQYTADGVNAPNATLANSQAGVVNMFYMSNIMHDLFLHYGFTEAAGNFQITNYGGQGLGGDAVVATAQDGSGVNNANFLTQEDGIAGRMRMFIFTVTSPSRDGALDNGVVAHELTHGLSSRLTGGAANANCLQTIQAGGMGEGWSDAVAVMMNVATTDTRASDKVVGAFVVGNPKGVRRFPYSTSLATNPHMYADVGVQANQEVHAIGEVWCTMLYEVYWNMVDQAGFTPVTNLINAATVGTAGNSDFFLILVRGMMLQPCNPTFIQARNAIVAADQMLTGGTYNCAIWKGFAKRGMGVNAAPFTNNFDLPATCPP
ncbi:Fungalysin metallopeptidase-domain-containing protein [Zopfochytrium polystomum]|nr:Fungalysin metallopeptidase-domain-containing protein [Zopfochytrium polystomum]